MRYVVGLIVPEALDVSSEETDDEGEDGWSEDWKTTWATVCLLTPEYAAMIVARKKESQRIRTEQWLTSLDV